VIRPATVDDAGAIAHLQVRAWLRSYADFVDPERMHADAVSAERWAGWIADPHLDVWVAEHAGGVVGFAAAGEGEVTALYVDPAAQGAGVGTLLLARAEDGLRERGARAAVAWVFEANGLARTFYETRGWHADGERTERADWWAPAVRYRREL